MYKTAKFAKEKVKQKVIFTPPSVKQYEDLWHEEVESQGLFQVNRDLLHGNRFCRMSITPWHLGYVSDVTQVTGSNMVSVCQSGSQIKLIQG